MNRNKPTVKITDEIFKYLATGNLSTGDKQHLASIIHKLAQERLGATNLISILFELQQLEKMSNLFLVSTARNLHFDSDFSFNILDAELVASECDCCPDSKYIYFGNALLLEASHNEWNWSHHSESLLARLDAEGMQSELANVRLAHYIHSGDSGFAPKQSVVFQFAAIMKRLLDKNAEKLSQGELRIYGAGFDCSEFRILPVNHEGLALYCKIQPYDLFDDEDQLYQPEVSEKIIGDQSAALVTSEPTRSVSSGKSIKRKKITAKVICERLDSQFLDLQNDSVIEDAIHFLEAKNLDYKKIDEFDFDRQFCEPFAKLLLKEKSERQLNQFFTDLTTPLFSDVVDSTKEGGPAISAFLKVLAGENILGTQYQWILRHPTIAEAYHIIQLQLRVKDSLSPVLEKLQLEKIVSSGQFHDVTVPSNVANLLYRYGYNNIEWNDNEAATDLLLHYRANWRFYVFPWKRLALFHILYAVEYAQNNELDKHRLSNHEWKNLNRLASDIEQALEVLQSEFKTVIFCWEERQ